MSSSAPFPYEDPEEGSAPTVIGLDIEIEETPNRVVARLWAPDGSVLLEMHERRIVPFGYRKG